MKTTRSSFVNILRNTKEEIVFLCAHECIDGLILPALKSRVSKINNLSLNNKKVALGN